MNPNMITVHCSASQNGVSVSVAEIEKWHKARGFNSIGYHYVVDVDGKVYDGRPVEKTGAHVENNNQGNIGICLVGTDLFTQNQFAALRSLVLGLCWKHNIDRHDVWCHYMFKSAIVNGKTCPNIPIQKIIAYLYDPDMSIFKQELLK